MIRIFSAGGAQTMLDIIFVGATALFVVLAILYVRGCERMRGAKP